MDLSQKDQFEHNERSVSFNVSRDRLDQMSLAELKEEMEHVLDIMTEETYNTTVIDAYLDAMDRKSPMPALPSAEDAYNALCKKLSQEIGAEMPSATQRTCLGRGRRIVRMGLVAAITAVCLLGGMVVAQATGTNVLGGLARWTEDIFSFGPIRSEQGPNTSERVETQANTSSFFDGLPAEYQELWTELEARGVDSFLFPTDIPDGFVVDESDLTILPKTDTVVYHVWYVNTSIEIGFQIMLSETLHSTFEKDANEVEVYNVNNTDHYIFSNNSQNVIAWYLDGLEYSLSSTLPIPELKEILNSMY